MRILMGCEQSQMVTEQFVKLGHDVMSCDLNYDGDKGYNHYKGSVLDVINDGWDMLIAFPPCTYLAKAQIHKLKIGSERRDKAKCAIEFVKTLYYCSIPKVIIENPIGLLSTAWRQPEQIVSPHEFGDAYKKDICLWLKGVNPLIIEGLPGDKLRMSGGRAADMPGTKYKKVVNHVNSRMSNEQRSKIKSSWKYFPNLAIAMAEQWGREAENA